MDNTTITLIFCRSNTIISNLVRLFTWSPWSHCGVVVENENGFETVIEAGYGYGVREITLNQFLAQCTHYEFKKIKVTDAAKGIAWVKQQVGKKYDWKGVLGLSLEHDWHQQDRWWCSEMTEGTVLAAGNQRFITNTKRITPELCYMVI